jgi:hypothetical protein
VIRLIAKQGAALSVKIEESAGQTQTTKVKIMEHPGKKMKKSLDNPDNICSN